jgi:hypothetical protein
MNIFSGQVAVNLAKVKKVLNGSTRCVPCHLHHSPPPPPPPPPSPDAFTYTPCLCRRHHHHHHHHQLSCKRCDFIHPLVDQAMVITHSSLPDWSDQSFEFQAIGGISQGREALHALVIVWPNRNVGKDHVG